MSFVGKSSQYYSGFSPTLIPDCVLWLDALDSNTLTLSGSNVTAWRDKSGRSNNSTGIVSTPTLRANSINGYPAVFLSSNAVRGGISPTISSNQLHCFMVVTALSTSGPYPRFLGLDDGVNAEYNSVTGIAAFGRNGGPNFTASRQNSAASVSAADNVPHIVTTYVISSNQYITVDGSTNFSSASSSTTANFAISKWNLGCETGGSAYWNPQAYVGEVLVFSTALSSNLRYQVEGYLATKWGLRPNIPAIHPFKTLAPFTRPFVPVDISGCAVWFDGMDTTSMTFSGSNIVQWLDKSGNGRHGSNVGTGNPILGTTTTGRQAVVMSGANYFRLSNAITLSPTSASYFVQACATTAGRTLLSFWANERILGPTYYWDNAANTSLSPYAWLNTNAVLSIVENSASNCTVHFNGNALTGPAYKAATANSNVYLGAHHSADFQWIGNIQEVILYDVALTPNQRQQVETYLTNKWGTRGATPSTHLARLAPALSTAFSPLLIGSCGLWLDAADSAAVAVSGSSVTQWNDKSGNGYHFITHPSHTAPTYSSNAINGVNSVFFQNGSGKQNILYNNSVPVNGPAFSIFTVARRNATAQSYTGANYILTDTGNIRLLYATYSSDFLMTSTANSTSGWNDITVNTPGQTLFTTTVSGMVVNGSVLTPYVSGTAQNTKGGTTTSFTGLSVGDVLNSGQSGQGWTGFICEIIIYGIALTTTQRQSIEGYLANKWKLTASLPSGHPYKAFKP